MSLCVCCCKEHDTKIHTKVLVAIFTSHKHDGLLCSSNKEWLYQSCRRQLNICWEGELRWWRPLDLLIPSVTVRGAALRGEGTIFVWRPRLEKARWRHDPPQRWCHRAPATRTGQLAKISQHAPRHQLYFGHCSPTDSGVCYVHK